MSKTFNILQLAGFGDTLSAIARLDSVKEEYPDYKIKFWLGGFGKAPEFSKKILEKEGYEATIIKNFSFHNQITQTKKLISEKLLNDGDILEDWSFCEEIFKNQNPVFYKYDFDDFYDYQYEEEDFKFALNKLEGIKKPIAIHVTTRSGNPEGFDRDLERGRFWSQEGWLNLINGLIREGYTPVIMGIKDDDWGVREFLEEDKYIDAMDITLDQTMAILRIVHGAITCNSWMWEITSKLRVPTYVLFTHNHFFLENHIPRKPSSFWDHTFFQTENISDHNEILNSFLKLFKEGRPKRDYSVCTITYNDDEYISRTLNNIHDYLYVEDKSRNCEHIVVDGGSKDKTIDILNSYSESISNSDVFKIFEHEWDDDFSKQKNFCISKAKNDWVVFIDADETYEHIFWNQLPWIIAEAEEKKVDCISFPRKNFITNLKGNELEEYAKKNDWKIAPIFNWVNYPDYQQRLFKSSLRYTGKTHERIVGYETGVRVNGIHCLHYKTVERQNKSFKLYQDQHSREGDRIANKIVTNIDGSRDTRPIVFHHLNSLCLGGTEKMVQLHLKYSKMIDDKSFNHVIAYNAMNDRTREPYFKDILGENKLIPYGSAPELAEILRKAHPSILHNYASGIAEFPMIKGIRELIPKTKLVQTAVFGNKNDQIDLDRIIHVSQSVKMMTQNIGDKHFVVRNPVEDVYSNDDLRSELGIPEDAFVFGRIGRDAENIYDPINLRAYANIQDENTHFIIIGASSNSIRDIERLELTNVHLIDKTTNEERLSKFYNTMDVLAHSRKDGECNPANVFEAFAHGKPVISHYGLPFNGHVECISDAGFVVNNDDVEEYTRYMKMFINKDIDYNDMSRRARVRWEKLANPEDRAREQLEIYKGLL